MAFEIAQQLVAQGQQVALLALLDIYAPGAIKQLLARERISAHWNNFLQLGPTYILEKTIENVKGKIQRFNNQLNHSFKKICCKFYLSIGQPLPDNLQDFTFHQENQEAASNYVPQAYPGRVSFFRAMDEIAGVSSYRDPLLGWGELAVGGVEIHEVPSTHLGMLQHPLLIRRLFSTMNATATLAIIDCPTRISLQFAITDSPLTLSIRLHLDQTNAEKSL